MKEGMKYHHMGIPTQVKKAGEEYLEEVKLWLRGSDKSPYGVEWLRFEKDSPMPELIKTVAHVGFEVDDLEGAIAGKKVIIEPTYADENLRYAFIEDDGAPIEFLQFMNK